MPLVVLYPSILAFVLQAAKASWAPSFSMHQSSSLEKMVDTSSVTRVEILHFPGEIETFSNMSPSVLRANYSASITLTSSVDRSRISGVLQTVRGTKMTPTTGSADVRWGVLFFDDHNHQLLSLYLDKFGKRGFENDIPMAFSDGIIKMLRSDFNCLEDAYERRHGT